MTPRWSRAPLLLVTVLLLAANVAFSQGTVVFSNHGGTSTTAAPGATLAPVYGHAPDDSRISGNTGTGVPMGSATYGGIPFLASDASHTFVATLWALDSSMVIGTAYNNNLQETINGTATFRTTTSGTFAGIWNQSSQPAIVPGVANEGQRATFQVRVWDTKGGIVTTWAQALSTGYEIWGFSDLFIVPFALGGTQAPPNPPPYLQNLQSFNVQGWDPPVPEPSILALIALAAGWLCFRGKRFT